MYACLYAIIHSLPGITWRWRWLWLSPRDGNHCHGLTSSSSSYPRWLYHYQVFSPPKEQPPQLSATRVPLTVGQLILLPQIMGVPSHHGPSKVNLHSGWMPEWGLYKGVQQSTYRVPKGFAWQASHQVGGHQDTNWACNFHIQPDLQWSPTQ